MGIPSHSTDQSCTNKKKMNELKYIVIIVVKSFCDWTYRITLFSSFFLRISVSSFHWPLGRDSRTPASPRFQCSSTLHWLFVGALNFRRSSWLSWPLLIEKDMYMSLLTPTCKLQLNDTSYSVFLHNCSHIAGSDPVWVCVFMFHIKAFTVVHGGEVRPHPTHRPWIRHCIVCKIFIVL